MMKTVILEQARQTLAASNLSSHSYSVGRALPKWTSKVIFFAPHLGQSVTRIDKPYILAQTPTTRPLI